MWARNIGNLMMSPVRPIEFVSALMVMSIVRLAIGVVPVTILAIVFFGFNLYSLGLALVAFFLNLMLTAWAVGIFVSGLVLRNGLGAENLAWSIMFLFMPLTCVYYPVSTLPAWLQPVSWALPPTYVFEGMRALLIQHTFRPDLMLSALGLNVVFFAGGVFRIRDELIGNGNGNDCVYLDGMTYHRHNAALQQAGLGSSMAIGEFGGAPAVPGDSSALAAAPMYLFYEMGHAALH